MFVPAQTNMFGFTKSDPLYLLARTKRSHPLFLSELVAATKQLLSGLIHFNADR